MRAALDPNVLTSAALSRSGPPGRLVRCWHRGDFELLISPALVAELERALTYPKIARLIPADEAVLLVRWLQEEAEAVENPSERPPIRSEDPGDDYLIALSLAHGAALVSGDKHLLALAADLPIYRPIDFLELLKAYDPGSLDC